MKENSFSLQAFSRYEAVVRVREFEVASCQLPERPRNAIAFVVYFNFLIFLLKLELMVNLVTFIVHKCGAELSTINTVIL